MKKRKINKTFLTISIACALVIFGLSMVVGMYFTVTAGLITGSCAYMIMIAFMLFYKFRSK